jgi:hypothetical protein
MPARGRTTARWYSSGAGRLAARHACSSARRASSSVKRGDHARPTARSLARVRRRYNPRVVRLALALSALAAIGCGAPAPRPEPPRDPEPAEAAPARPARPARTDLDTGQAPTSIAIVGATLLWTDVMGGIWAMPADGSGAPRQLSDQRAPDFAFQLFTAGGEVLATSRGDLLRVGVPGGPVTRARIGGLAESPLEVVADASHVYLTLFKRPEILRVPVAGGAATKLAELPRAVLALHGDTLYAASYATGVLVAIATATGRSRVVARGLARPTAIAADRGHVYAYCEHDRTLRRIDAATGAMTELARGLVNSDRVELDGDYVYTRTWGARPALVRVPKDGSRPHELLAELPTPTDIAFDASGVYVASRDGRRIVRLDRAALAQPRP